MRATLLREPLDVAAAPARAALILRGDERPFALIGAWAGGGALLGSEPVRVSGPDDDLFALLDEVPAVADAAADDDAAAPAAAAAPDGAAAPAAATGAVGGGWFGYLGFEARHRVE